VAFLIVLLCLALVGVVVWFVGAPLRRARTTEGGAASPAGGAGAAPPSPQAAIVSELRARDALEAAREAKYREIRDTELDFRTGKLSQEDYRTIDADLRAEAIEILNELERAGSAVAGTPGENAVAPDGADA
jgi:hypothetical protein